MCGGFLQPPCAAGGNGGVGGSAGAGGADPTMVMQCAQKLCIDPIFDCVLQGCGFAACENLHCIIH